MAPGNAASFYAMCGLVATFLAIHSSVEVFRSKFTVLSTLPIDMLNCGLGSGPSFSSVRPKSQEK